ncbi:MAG: hypothetical protein ACRCWR_00590 [Saezia sp.]
MTSSEKIKLILLVTASLIIAFIVLSNNWLPNSLWKRQNTHPLLVFYCFAPYIFLHIFKAPRSAYAVVTSILLSLPFLYIGRYALIHPSPIPEKNSLEIYEGRVSIDFNLWDEKQLFSKHWQLIDANNQAHTFTCVGALFERGCAIGVGYSAQELQNKPIKVWAQDNTAWEIEIAGQTTVESYEFTSKMAQETALGKYNFAFYIGLLILGMTAFLLYLYKTTLAAFIFSPFVWLENKSSPKKRKRQHK